MAGLAWSDAEVKILKDMLAAGADCYDIGIVLTNRTVNSIRNKMDEMQLKCKRPDPEINQEAFRRFMKGRS